MSLPPRFHSDLWRRIAEAQDVSLRGDPQNDKGQQQLRDVGRDVARVIAARDQQSRWRMPALAMGAVAVAAAVLVVPRVWHRQPAVPALSVSKSPVPGARQGDEPGVLVADARSDLPLRFSDGSTVTFRAGSSGRMQRLTGSGAEIVLERGRLDAHVVHADTTLWLLHAGPYRVRVTGTRFAMNWAAPNFEVDLFEGAVVVDGAELGAGVPLRAGHRLKIAAGTVLVEPLSAAAAVSDAVPAEAPSGTMEVPAADVSDSAVNAAGGRTARRSSDEEWLVLAERGAYRQALAAAKRLGWNDLCRRLDARQLLTLGDVARYSGAQAKARQAFAALVTKFPENRLAADAVFSLGRMAFESRRPEEATRWFTRYVADWPQAPLADQAAGRLLECAIRVENHQAARTAAERYLMRAPHGPHATLAREVLEQPADGSQ